MIGIFVVIVAGLQDGRPVSSGWMGVLGMENGEL